MENKTTQYDKRLSEYRDRLLQRNKEMTSDDDDRLDRIINGEEYLTKPEQSEQPEQSQQPTKPERPVMQERQTKPQQPARREQEKKSPVRQEKNNDAQVAATDATPRTNRQPESRARGARRPFRINRLGKWSIACIALLLVFIVVTVCYIAANKAYKYNQMDIRPIDKGDIQVNDAAVKQETKGYTTIALYGVDSRDSNLNAGTNSDAILIVSINDETKEVKLVSVYRDFLVQIYEDTDGELETQKVNYAYQLGGAETSINTLNTNLDLYITDYITVDFGAMSDIINALGGVEVTVTEDEVNNLNKNLAEQIGLSGTYSDGVHEAGTQILNGQQAVAYSRIRSTEQGDITRTVRQRTVLLALAQKTLSADKTTLASLIDVSFDGISTSFTKDEINDIADDVGDYTITANVGFPFAYSATSLTDKGSVLVAADLSANVTALHEYLYGVSGYTPTTALTAISSTIASETGVASAGAIDVAAAIAASSVQISDSGSTEDSATSEESSDGVKTLTEPPAGMLENE